MTDKPHRQAGTVCPLWRKDVSKVCHTCEFYQPLPVRDNSSGRVFEQWRCYYVHAPFLLREIISEVNGLQGKQAEFNDRVYKETQENVQVLIPIMERIERQHERSVRAIARAVDAVTHETKLINGTEQ